MSTAQSCESCGMPIETGRYCSYCTDENGALQSFDIRFERMVGWQARRHPGTSRQEIERQTLDYMATMPAWRDHPRVTANRARRSPDHPIRGVTRPPANRYGVRSVSWPKLTGIHGSSSRDRQTKLTPEASAGYRISSSGAGVGERGQIAGRGQAQVQPAVADRDVEPPRRALVAADVPPEIEGRRGVTGRRSGQPACSLPPEPRTPR